MENYQHTATSLIVQGMPVNQKIHDHNSLEECRRLVRILAEKTEALSRECGFDHDNATHIHAMGTTVATLTALVNNLGTGMRNCPAGGMLEDASGNSYHAVRSCDLDRISDK